MRRLIIWSLLSPGTRQRVDWCVWRNVSESRDATIFRAVYFLVYPEDGGSNPPPPQTQGLYTSLQDILSEKAGMFIDTAVTYAYLSGNWLDIV